MQSSDCYGECPDLSEWAERSPLMSLVLKPCGFEPHLNSSQADRPHSVPRASASLLLLPSASGVRPAVPGQQVGSILSSSTMATVHGRPGWTFNAHGLEPFHRPRWDGSLPLLLFSASLLFLQFCGLTGLNSSLICQWHLPPCAPHLEASRPRCCWRCLFKP